MNAFGDKYKGKRVLITGHTGFKGSWLSLWLLELGAEVAGYSLYLPTEPCNFEALGLEEKVEHHKGDIRDKESLSKVFESFKPEIVFHLAAQPIVRVSYDDPKLTFDTNVGGTVNVLECLRSHSFVKAAVIITSDKCYDNVSWDWGYRENDRLGGDDPYSASKACAELVSRAYIKSYFNKNEATKIITTRAGNVIGGGDWAQDRIIPDCIKSWSKGQDVVIRNPEATRPWQHVLEPLSGYLSAGAKLLEDPHSISGEAFNFGPDNDVVKSVKEIVSALSSSWDGGSWKTASGDSKKKESMLLKLCYDKALSSLGWCPALNFEETVKMTSEWYKSYCDKKSMYNISRAQISSYTENARGKNIKWAQGEDS